jgi:hypothetical protein
VLPAQPPGRFPLAASRLPSIRLFTPNEKGDILYMWSEARLFILIIPDEKFGPGEKTFGATLPLEGLPRGRHMIEAYLTTSPILYQGQVSFEIG